jgi:hypothetical protein
MFPKREQPQRAFDIWEERRMSRVAQNCARSQACRLGRLLAFLGENAHSLPPALAKAIEPQAG